MPSTINRDNVGSGQVKHSPYVPKLNINKSILPEKPPAPQNIEVTRSRLATINKTLKAVMTEDKSSERSKYSNKFDIELKATRSMSGRTPRVYKYKDYYERKRTETLQRKNAEARKMREFRSRPVPNFDVYHKRLTDRPMMHSVTVPITPDTLRKSTETEKKRQFKLQQWERQQLSIPKIQFHSTAYLNREPFMPKPAGIPLVETKPFKLRSDERLKARKKFNAAARLAREKRERQEQKRRQKFEEDEYKAIRKLTQFKARPNPYKRWHTRKN